MKQINKKSIIRIYSIIPIVPHLCLFQYSNRLLAFCISLIILSANPIFSLQSSNYAVFQKQPGSFTLSESSNSVPLVASEKDFPGVHRVLKHLQTDIAQVTNLKPEIVFDKIPSSKEIVLVGTLGKNEFIEQLIKENKLDVKNISGKWETFLIQVIENPFPDVDKALVITGSDKRGTIYGMYDLAEKIGVSPWYWWADVPVKKHADIYIKPGSYSTGEPKVKYRGIFINDEAPALTGWTYEKFGGYNSKMYEKVFELILRLKGNYLWPAMWNNSFATDDPLNPKLADELGVVVGTSHHEPMTRAWKEWERAGHKPGSWDYTKNEKLLREFWREGVERTKDYEKIVTLAMRGDGDEPMSEDANIKVLQKIVEDQREILSEVTGKKITEIPQVWALYKEVQDYYDKGMRVPDDVTLLLCDDNWGNLRVLPKPTPQPPSKGRGSISTRKGGYGIYYHYDFVGGPRNYKWINTNQIERVWEQMHLAYEYGAREIWIVNVGDIKPMEFPINFFLDYAWNPEKITAEDLPNYYNEWSEEQFGQEYSNNIAELIAGYTKFNSRRKPEMLSQNTYSLFNYREFETVVSDYNKLADKANQIYVSIPAEYKDAFFHLVLHPVTASANLNEMYLAVAKNHLYAKQGRSAVNSYAEKVKALFAKDSLISHYYNKLLANGKWNHMMDQTHISYTYWQQPEKDVFPEIKLISVPDEAEMGVAVEGSDKWFPQDGNEATLPEFDKFNQQSYYIEIFNRGKIPFDYEISSDQPWIIVSQKYDKIESESRIWISIDWKNAPSGKTKTPIHINGNGKQVTVFAVINNPPEIVNGFIESNGYVSIEANNFSNKINSEKIEWIEVPNLGRTQSGMIILPVTAEAVQPENGSPRLEYNINFINSGEVKVYVYLSPTLKFNARTHEKEKGLRYAVSFDDEKPQIVNIHAADTIPDWKYPQWWNNAVANNIRVTSSQHTIKNPGEHILKIWMVDPAVVIQKIVVETQPGGVKQSYLGPPESYKKSKSASVKKL